MQNYNFFFTNHGQTTLTMRGLSKVIMHGTPCHSRDYLCHICKESIQNCTWDRKDTAWVSQWWLNLAAFLGTAESEVHIVHISCVIAAYTLESLSSLTQITHNLQATINFKKKGHSMMCNILAVLIVTLRLNALEDIGQALKSLHATHSLILLFMCAKHGKNPLPTAGVVERIWQDVA